MTGSSIIHQLGDPDGFAVAPQRHAVLAPDAGVVGRAARERRLRMIGIDRPGYGNAPTEPNRSLRSVAHATAAVMNDLGVDRFAVIGVSGGGPYALACGAFLPDRVAAVTSAAGSSGFDPLLDSAQFTPEELELTRAQAQRPTTEGRQALARFETPRSRTCER